MAWEENSRICLHMQLIAFLSRIGVNIEKMAENERAHFAILLNPLATAINKVEAGIDIENSQKQLIDEGKKLCRTYKL